MIEESSVLSGGHIFASGKYGYIQNKKRGNNVYLLCRANRNFGCKGRAVVHLDSLQLVVTNEHTCESSRNVERKKPKKKPKKTFPNPAAASLP